MRICRCFLPCDNYVTIFNLVILIIFNLCFDFQQSNSVSYVAIIFILIIKVSLYCVIKLPLFIVFHTIIFFRFCCFLALMADLYEISGLYIIALKIIYRFLVDLHCLCIFQSFWNIL